MVTIEFLVPVIIGALAIVALLAGRFLIKTNNRGGVR